MVQYRTIIEEEEYLIDKKRVEVLNTHIRLPSSCELENLGCVVQKTYLWNVPNNQCQLAKINTGKFTEEQGYVIEHRAKLLFKIHWRNPKTIKRKNKRTQRICQKWHYN